MKKKQKKIVHEATGSTMMTKITIAAVAAAACIGGGTIAVKKINTESTNTKVVTPSGIQNVEDENETTATSEETAVSTVSVLKRGLDIDGVEPLLYNTDSSSGFLAVEISEDLQDPFHSEYRTDVLLVSKDGKYGINDYDGNQIQEIMYDKIHYDLKYMDEARNRYGTWAYIYHESAADDELYTLSKDLTVDYATDNEFGGTRCAEYQIMNGHLYNVIFGGYMIESVDSVSEAPTTFLTTSSNGVGVADPEGTVYSDMSGYYETKWPFTNGYIFLLENPADLFEDENGVYHKSITSKLALFNGMTGEQITDFEFEDAGYIWNGYAPVKKDGMWGFVDETGKLVVDYIFEDASSLHDGKAYVKYNSEWMIINVVESLQNGEITAETMNASLA